MQRNEDEIPPIHREVQAPRPILRGKPHSSPARPEAEARTQSPTAGGPTPPGRWSAAIAILARRS